MAGQTSHDDQDMYRAAIMSELAYLKLENFKGDFTNPNSVIEFIQNSHSDVSGILPEQQNRIIKTLGQVTLLNFTHDDKTDAQAFFVKDNTSGDYITAFRGTESLTDVRIDARIGAININSQYAPLSQFTLTNQNSLPAGSKHSLAGHSLGGMNVQQISAHLKIPGIAINALGMDALNSKIHLPNLFGLGQKITHFLGLKTVNQDFTDAHLLTLSSTDDGIIDGDPLSNLVSGATGASHTGQVLDIELGKNASFTGGHSIINMVTALEEYQVIIKAFEGQLDNSELSQLYADFGRADTLKAIADATGIKGDVIQGLMKYQANKPLALNQLKETLNKQATEKEDQAFDDWVTSQHANTSESSVAHHFVSQVKDNSELSTKADNDLAEQLNVPKQSPRLQPPEIIT
ncbi:MAG: hypothetical protein HOM11_04605 [Methylococcales bacterium]|jgi:hypothetical protein|nr:hypothetical protein [Methylococcales bacterium]MBT7443786.1 hypothetical protein [Methylococcales bacterium]